MMSILVLHLFYMQKSVQYKAIHFACITHLLEHCGLV